MANNQRKVDLHLHTSSGSDDARNNIFDLFYYCLQNNVRYGAITDHDNIDPWNELCQVLGKDPTASHFVHEGITMISGVEVNCFIPFKESDTSRNRNVHCQVLGANLREPHFAQLLRLKSLDEKHTNMCIKISQLLHLVTFKDEKTRSRTLAMLDTVFNKTDLDPGDIDYIIVDFMQDNNISARSHRELYKFEVPFFPKMSLSPEHLCRFAHAAGGHVIWAHPGISVAICDKQQEIIDYMVESGIDGAETLHNFLQTSINDMILTSADRHGKNSFLQTAGSDNHSHPEKLGQIKVPGVGTKNCIAKDFQESIDTILQGHEIEPTTGLVDLIEHYRQQFEIARTGRNQCLRQAVISMNGNTQIATATELMEEISKFDDNYQM